MRGNVHVVHDEEREAGMKRREEVECKWSETNENGIARRTWRKRQSAQRDSGVEWTSGKQKDYERMKGWQDKGNVEETDVSATWKFGWKWDKRGLEIAKREISGCTMQVNIKSESRVYFLATFKPKKETFFNGKLTVAVLSVRTYSINYLGLAEEFEARRWRYAWYVPRGSSIMFWFWFY
jgi:hypothetical protein